MFRDAMPAEHRSAVLCFKLFALGATVHYVHVLRCGAVQGLIAGQLVVAAKRVTTFDSAADSPCVGLKDGSFRPVSSLNPAHFGVHVLAGRSGAGRCGEGSRGGAGGG